MEKEEKQNRATVRLVNRGKKHPFIIEIMTPGWRGCEQAFLGKIELPGDVKEILALLDRANVQDRKILFMADGATEIVLDNSVDFEASVHALVASGWMLPGMPLSATLH